VVVNGRRKEVVEETIKRLKQEVKDSPGGTIEGVVADVASAEGCRILTEAVPFVDILVNNVGIFKPVPFEKTTDDVWLEHFNVNVMSGVRLSRFYLSKMLEANWGRIIFISSESAFRSPTEMIHYGMTKTAQVSISRGLAELTAGTKVTVNTVLPGPTMTEGVKVWLEELSQKSGRPVAEEEVNVFKEGSRSSSLVKRFLDPDEVANAVLYIASPISSATNGATIRAEGGLLNHI